MSNSEIAYSVMSEFKPDMALGMTSRPGKDGKRTLEPFVPETSLAGSFRHWLSRRQRVNGERIWDPVAQTDYCGDKDDAKDDANDVCIELLLGSRRGSGAKTKRLASKLLVREAYLADTTARDAWSVSCQEHVAVDPYRQKPKRGSKFNRYALFAAQFEWQLVLELDTSAKDGEVVKLIEAFLESAKNARVGFGSGEARGHGHLRFVDIRRAAALAGDAVWTDKEPFLAVKGA